MTISEISNTYVFVNKHLSERKFAGAFFLINRLVAELKDWNTTCRYEELVSFYRNILNFRLTGAEEEDKNSVFNRFLTDLYSLAETAKEQLFIKYSSAFEYDRIRLFAADARYFIPKDVQSIGTIYDILLNHYLSLSVNDLINNQLTEEDEHKLFEKHQKVLGFIFHNIWLSFKNNTDDFESITNILNDENIGIDAKCISLSALTLNILRVFNQKKLEVLFGAVKSENQEIRQRALVGITLLIAKFGHYFKSDEKLKNRFLAFVEENDCLNEMESIVFQLIRTSETEGITRRIQEDIFPEFMKMSPILRQKFKNIDKKDDNPDWEDFFDENDINSEKLEEFGDMQMSGSDVYASTFAQMKNSPFFQPIENWFVPFDKNHPMVKPLFKQKKTLLNMIFNNSALCNSDKYAFSISLLSMPEKERGGMEISLKQQKEQMDDVIKEMKTLQAHTEEKITANHYIQDLYRFYTQYQRHYDFENPLREVVNLINKSIFYTIFSDKEKMKNIAGYYFAYNYYNQALKLYLRIFEHKNPDFDIARKIGYCYQKNGQHKDALRFYLAAENLDKNDTWTLKRMAFCYRKTGNFRAAADCYSRILELKTEDLKSLFSQAMCYIESANFENALPLLHKINYLKPEYPKLKNVLLWCSFCCGKMEQAKDFSQKVLADKPDVQDFIVIANIHLALNDKKTALEFYQKALSSVPNFNVFNEIFNHSKDILLKLGIKKADIDLLIELALMDKLPAVD